jgi:hypothetical protein
MFLIEIFYAKEVSPAKTGKEIFKGRAAKPGQVVFIRTDSAAQSPFSVPSRFYGLLIFKSVLLY